MTAPILIWEQHAGQPPVQHAETRSLDAVPDMMKAWLAQFAGRVVSTSWSGDAVLVSEISVSPSLDLWLDNPIATLWIEHPDDLVADMVSRRLDARWRGPARGASLDTRDGTRRRVSR